MAIFNRILSVLIVLLAIAVAVFSFLLFQRRHEFRERADMLAQAVEDTAASIDQKSATGYAEKLSFQPAKGEQPQSGALSWQEFHESKNPDTGSFAAFEKLVALAAEAASKLNAQRNLLAEKLAETAITLGIDEEKAQPTDLKNLANADLYTSVSEAVVKQANAIVERDARMLQTLSRAGDIIEHPIDETPFEEREKSIGESDEAIQIGEYRVGPELTTLEGNIDALKSRCDEYAETLASTLFSRVDLYAWQADANTIKSEDNYTTGLRDLVEDFRGINRKLRELQITKQDLADTKEQLAETEQDLVDAKGQIAKHENTIRKQKKQIDRLLAQRGIGSAEEIVDIDKDLRGEVLQVNPEWGFIVTDLGRKEINQGMELLVARDDGFVARVMITRVLDDISVAEIKPEVVTGTIATGDRLILPKEEE